MARRHPHSSPTRRRLFQSAAEDRPGHAFRIDEKENKVVYMEDQIMEMILGRPLELTECVMHRNGNPLDNRRDNLELVIMPEIEQ